MANRGLFMMENLLFAAEVVRVEQGNHRIFLIDIHLCRN